MSDSPRQARSRATRATVLRAAALEFVDHGYEAASLSRIIDRCGVTKGGLYFHFTSKNAMALVLIERMGEAFREVAERSRGERRDPLRAAARVARAIQDLLHADVEVRAGRRLAQDGVGGDDWAVFVVLMWQDLFTEHFVRARTDGLLRPGLDPADLGRHCVDISGGAFRSSLLATGMRDLAQRVRFNWELMFAAAADPEWLAGWRSSGGMAAVLGEHVSAPAGEPVRGLGGEPAGVPVGAPDG